MMQRCVYIVTFLLLSIGCKQSKQEVSAVSISKTNSTAVESVKDAEELEDTLYNNLESHQEGEEDTNVVMASQVDTITQQIEEQNSTGSVKVTSKELVDKPIITKKKKSYTKGRALLDSITFKTIVFDYDTITEGDVIKYKFEFENRNKKAIEVASTYPDCGCTIPSFPFLALDQGDKGHIGVTYNSVGKNGVQESAIHVKFKGIKEERILMLKGFVKAKPKTKKSDTVPPE